MLLQKILGPAPNIKILCKIITTIEVIREADLIPVTPEVILEIVGSEEILEETTQEEKILIGG